MGDRRDTHNAGDLGGGVGGEELRSAVAALAGSIEREPLSRRGAAPGRASTGGSSAGGGAAGGGLVESDLGRVREMMDLLRRLMFPGYFDPECLPGGSALRDHVGVLCARVSAHLVRLVEAVRGYGREEGGSAERSARGPDWANGVTRTFMSRLAAVREMLSEDVLAAYEGDPAAEHTDEIILCYPGLEAVFAQRIGHELYALGVPVLPRIISEQAHSRTGIDIHPGAAIGRRFFVDHGSGVVIGETTVIGDRVKVYQGVTLGARSFPRDKDGRVIRRAKRHPTIGNDVTIYAGAVILGGDTVIGDGCVIAGGVFVTSSVPAGHVVQQVRPDLTLRPMPAAGGPAGADRAAKSGAQGAGKPGVDVGWLADGAGI